MTLRELRKRHPKWSIWRQGPSYLARLKDSPLSLPWPMPQVDFVGEAQRVHSLRILSAMMRAVEKEMKSASMISYMIAKKREAYNG